MAPQCLCSFTADLAELDLELKVYPDYDAGPTDDPDDPNDGVKVHEETGLPKWLFEVDRYGRAAAWLLYDRRTAPHYTPHTTAGNAASIDTLDRARRHRSVAVPTR